MAATEAPELLTPADAPACQPLSDEAGWNQVRADWAMMLAHGHAPGVREDGRPVASALALPMGGRIGWISMVLVTAAKRRQGIAQRLVGECIDWLEAQGMAPHLDATPAGQPLYTRMGFEGICGLTRMIGDGGAGRGVAADGGARNGEVPEQVRDAGGADAEWIAALDAEAFGADRGHVIRDLLSRPGALALVRPDRTGVLLTRAGRTATQIGPVIAPDADAAIALIEAALARVSGPVMIDCFDDHPAIRAALEARGFTVQRPFLRMARGMTTQSGRPDRMFAAAGPELG